MKSFYMIYVWGKEAPVARHDTLKKAVDEAERLRTITENSIYILHTMHCLEGLEPPKSEKRKLKDKAWHSRFKIYRQQKKAQKVVDEKAVM